MTGSAHASAATDASPPDILRRILDTKADEVATARRARPSADVERAARDEPAPRGFVRALRASRPAVIAEVKRASPSKGLLRADFDPAAIARSYEAGGATCLSVLTDRTYFQGSDEALRAARVACRLPVLRKDFLVDPYQVAESRAIGADCVLLIVAALDDSTLRTLHDAARGFALDVLIEVHDAHELARVAAMPIDAAHVAVGINNRDLRTFETHLDTTLGLLDGVPPGVTVVTESGIATATDVARMRAAGVDAFLVGETFMRAPDPGRALAELFG
jgi:indole-3-glycerol phosphate synthase